MSEKELSENLRLFEIEKAESEKIKKLTLLEKRKLMLLRSYIKKPDIMFVDDIFCNLEKEESLKLLKILKIASEKTALVFACGSYSYKLLKEDINNLGFDQTLYLNFANIYKYKKRA